MSAPLPPTKPSAAVNGSHLCLAGPGRLHTMLAARIKPVTVLVARARYDPSCCWVDPALCARWIHSSEKLISGRRRRRRVWASGEFCCAEVGRRGGAGPSSISSMHARCMAGRGGRIKSSDYPHRTGRGTSLSPAVAVAAACPTQSGRRSVWRIEIMNERPGRGRISISSIWFTRRRWNTFAPSLGEGRPERPVTKTSTRSSGVCVCVCVWCPFGWPDD
jgi:hypothetical protein